MVAESCKPDYSLHPFDFILLWIWEVSGSFWIGNMPMSSWLDTRFLRLKLSDFSPYIFAVTLVLQVIIIESKIPARFSLYSFFDHIEQRLEYFKVFFLLSPFSGLSCHFDCPNGYCMLFSRSSPHSSVLLQGKVDLVKLAYKTPRTFAKEFYYKNTQEVIVREFQCSSWKWDKYKSSLIPKREQQRSIWLRNSGQPSPALWKRVFSTTLTEL